MASRLRHFSLLAAAGVCLLGLCAAVALASPQPASPSPDTETVSEAFSVLERISATDGHAQGDAALRESCRVLSRLGDEEVQRQWKARGLGFDLPFSVRSLCGQFLLGESSSLDFGEGLKRTFADTLLGEGLALARGSGLPYLSRIEVEGGITDTNGQFSIMSIQPWWEDRKGGHFLFNQVSWQRETLDTDDGDADDTVNFGLAYRKLLNNDTLLVGANMFFDHQFDQNHNRVSLGVDARTDRYGIAANRYQPLSKWRTIDALYESRALAGWDVEVSGQLPEYPELTGFVRAYTWDSLLGVKDIYGLNATVEWSPVPALVFSGGVTDENMRDPDLRFAMRIRMNFDEPLADQFRKRTGLQSVADRVYDRVRRENTIRIQVRKRLSTGLVVTETSGSNSAVTDEGTLALAAGLSFNMPATVTVANSAGAIARIRLTDGGILTIGQNSQVRIEPGVVTLITGTAQYISGSTNVTVNVPGGTITLLGTDIDVVSDGSTSTVRVRDGAVTFAGAASGSASLSASQMAQSSSGAVAAVATGSPTYNTHGSTVSSQIERIASPLNESKAAPYPVQAPRVTADATAIGQTLSVSLKFSKAVTVSGGTPQLNLTIGGNSRVAALTGGSGSDDLTFGYVLQAADVGNTSLTVIGLNANGASITGDGKQAVITIAQASLSFTGITDPCAGAPAVGTVCADGSVYAGNSPDGNVPMFVTRCDLGQTWDGSACTGTRTLRQWNDGSSNWLDTPLANCTTNSPNAVAACNEGKGNSAFLNTADSSSAAGTQPHLAAQACESLNIHGKDDWYLPAQGELYVMWQNRLAIDNFLLGGQFYWSSSEHGNNGARSIRFSDGFQSNNVKNGNPRVRCARR
ncbi:DUF1566 domain-containing protein [bacterium]|nr:DUF1566 domain-containing protein [bacterium]